MQSQSRFRLGTGFTLHVMLLLLGRGKFKFSPWELTQHQILNLPLVFPLLIPYKLWLIGDNIDRYISDIFA